MSDPPAPLKIVPIAAKSSSCHAWSGEQCVAAFLDDIRIGKIAPAKLMILWYSEDVDGNLRPHRWFAQIGKAEGIALLELAKAQMIAEWKV